MEMLWWILPALAAVVGLMLSFAGIGRLLKMQMLTGGLRFIFGILFLLGGFGIGWAGLNLQTYKRLTHEQVVATISFDKRPGVDDSYSVKMLLPEGEVRTIDAIRGDEFSLGAQVITYKPMSQMLGFDSVYRLEYLEGRYARRYNTSEVQSATSTGLQLYENPGLDVYALAKQEGARFGVTTGQRDAKFGSAVYAPMADGLEYEVSLSQSALILRPSNAAAKARLRTQGD